MFRPFRRPILRAGALACSIAACFASLASAQEASKEPVAVEYRPVPLDGWNSLPVFDGGRVKPLDTYASQILERVTGIESSKIEVGLADRLDLGAMDFVCGGRETFDVGGKSRTFTPGELIKSWILESDAWNDVPCILVPPGDLRKKLSADADGYVTPSALETHAKGDLAADFKKLDEQGDAAEGVPGDVRELHARREVYRRWAVAAAKHADAWRSAFEIFPTDEKLKLTPEEIVLSWLVEPERWEAVPFLPATHFELRETLGVPEKNDRNVHLKYVSPLDVTTAEGLSKYIRARFDRQMAERMEFKETDGDERVAALLANYAAFREASGDPSLPLQYGPLPLRGNRTKYVSTLEEALGLIQEKNARDKSMADSLRDLADLGIDQRFSASAQAFFESFPPIFKVYDSLTNQSQAVVAQGVPPQEARDTYPVTMEEAETATLAFRDAVDQLADYFREQKDRIYESDRATPEQRRAIGPMFRELSAKADELKRLARELEKALYDQDQMIHVLPDLDPYALAKDRDADARNLPWVSLQTVLQADRLLEGYPKESLESVRRDWKRLADAYRDRSDPKRAEKFGEALSAFRGRLASLGRAVESRRTELVEKTLPADRIDQTLIEYTEYPQSTRKLDLEVRYNELRPFGWSFVLSLMALGTFSLAFGRLRRPLFWVGMAVLSGVVLWTAYAFYLRVSITGWAPVTNMYETVVFVPFVVCVMAIWFLLLPAVWPGFRDSWRMTALPFTWEESSLTTEQSRRFSPIVWKGFSWLSAVARVGLMGFVLYHLAFAPHADGKRAVFPLAPTVHDSVGSDGGSTSIVWASSFNDLFVWGLGLVCLAAAMWIVPRVTLTAFYSIAMVPYDLVSDRESWKRRIDDCVSRYPFALGAAGACVLFFSVATFSSDIDENFSPLQPVLRSNYWLTIHVLTIVASYGAGMLAWALGLIAQGYYLFGKYERIGASKTLPEGADLKRLADLPPGGEAARTESDLQEGFVHVRAPEECRTLAGYCYRAIQVAVVLLATGTILGGLWADVSWGRFWGWDPKEVWALISFLVYMAILHGRYAGYFNSFGLIFGTVAGATAIAMSWYGVNFALPQLAGGNVGLHSYGSGSGGLLFVGGFVAINWLLLTAAAFRYAGETSSNRRPPEE